MSITKKDWRKILPGVIVSAICLAVIFYLVDLHRFGEALRQADLRLVALLVLVSLSWTGVRMLVWRTLLQEQATLSQVFLTLNEGYLLNNLLPFRLGEVGRAFLLSRKANLGFMQVVSTIVIERALDVAMAVGLLLGSLPFVIGGGDLARQAALAAGGLVLVGLAALYLLARNQAWALRQFERLSDRIPLLKKVGRGPLIAFFEGLAALKDGARFLRVLVFMLLNWAVAVLQFYVLLRAFFPEAQVLWAVFTLSVMALGIAAPSSPGAVGVLEVSIIGALSAFGLDPSTSLAAALTSHLTGYLTTGLIGAYALAKDGLTLSGLYRQVRQTQT
jgi:uncharacterized protein (TIRG00374 family)